MRSRAGVEKAAQPADISDNQKLLTGRNVALVLFAVWAVSAIGRFILALLTSVTPSIMPDESLYLQLAQSLHDNGRILYSGQPVNYTYISYSVLISPLFSLPGSVNIFRAIQLFNALVMSSAVFPSYFIARKLNVSRSKALLSAALTLLIPDMIMVNHIMVEAVSFPLILLMVLLSFQLIGSKKRSLPLCAGCAVLGVFLYTLKPGYIAVSVVLALVLLWISVRDKNISVFFDFLTFSLAVAALLLLWRAFVSYGLGADLTLKSIYGSQTAPVSSEHIKVFLCGMLVYIIYVPMGFLFFPIALPLDNIRLLGTETKRKLAFTLLSLLLVIVGTVYIVFFDERSSDIYSARVHLRYIAAFLPVLTAFCLSDEMKDARINVFGGTAAAGAIGGMLLIRGFDYYSTRWYPLDSLLLSAYATDSVYFNGKLLVPLILTVFIAAFCLLIKKYGLTSRVQMGFLIFIAATFLVNNAFGYDLNRHSTDKQCAADAIEAAGWAEGCDALYVAADGTIKWEAKNALDVASRCRITAVEFDDIIGNMTVGGLDDFVPKAYWTESPSNEIASPEKIILDASLLDLCVIDASTSIEYTSNGYYALITPTEGISWLHSALSGLESAKCAENTEFSLYNADLLSGDGIILRIKAQAISDNAVLTFGFNGFTYSCDISKQSDWYAVSVYGYSHCDPLQITLSCDGEAYILSYTVEAGEASD